MPTVEEVLNSAQMFNFDYAIIFVNERGEVRVAIGLNGLTHKINTVITTYIDLLNKLGAKYSTYVYDVKTKQQISILDIPMFFSIVEDTGNPTTKPSGYM